jgi:hypothetical protein
LHTISLRGLRIPQILFVVADGNVRDKRLPEGEQIVLWTFASVGIEGCMVNPDRVKDLEGIAFKDVAVDPNAWLFAFEGCLAENAEQLRDLIDTQLKGSLLCEIYKILILAKKEEYCCTVEDAATAFQVALEQPDPTDAQIAQSSANWEAADCDAKADYVSFCKIVAPLASLQTMTM